VNRVFRKSMLIVCSICISFSSQLSRADSERYILRAPLDGYVKEISKSGDSFQGGLSESQIQYDRFRQKMLSDLRWAKDAKSLDSVTKPVAIIFSDILQIQYLREEKRLSIANEQLTLAKSVANLEKGVAGAERANQLAMTKLNKVNAQLQIKNTKKIIKEEIDTIGHETTMLNDRTLNVFDKRQQHSLSALDTQITIAEKELASARDTLDMLKANISQGIVSCPTECVVTKVFVMKGQFVTKGDEILEVEINRE
jgi:biotin carboxyl carrier protein